MVFCLSFKLKSKAMFSETSLWISIVSLCLLVTVAIANFVLPLQHSFTIP